MVALQSPTACGEDVMKFISKANNIQVSWIYYCGWLYKKVLQNANVVEDWLMS